MKGMVRTQQEVRRLYAIKQVEAKPDRSHHGAGWRFFALHQK